ncbi:MAG: hypothetical protein V1738_05505 [Patescibacteria group bacterium]
MSGNQTAVIVEDKNPRPLRRRFIGYSFKVDNSAQLVLIDKYEELDFKTRSYIYKEDVLRLPACIKPQNIASHLNDLTAVCNSLRQELEQCGLKIFFDPAPNEELRPKWRYRLNGQIKTDYMTIAIDSNQPSDSYEEDSNQLPQKILQLVRRDNAYHTTLDWKLWFGRKMQKKREEIIISSLFELSSKTN